MAVLRGRFSGSAILLSVFLSACTGSTETDNVIAPEPISLSGSVGDGPAVGADLVVTDASGAVLEQRTSDSAANYQLTLGADVALPVLTYRRASHHVLLRRSTSCTRQDVSSYPTAISRAEGLSVHMQPYSH